MKIEVWPPGPPVCTTFKPGTLCRTSGKVRACWASMSAAVMSVTLLATSSSGVGTRVALTIMRGNSSSAGAVPSWASVAGIRIANTVATTNATDARRRAMV